MQAIVLAAGYGSRLGDMTAALPKPMIPIGRDRTMLSTVLGNLESMDISRTVIMVGHANGAIERWVEENGHRYPFELSIEPVRNINGSNASTLLDGLTAHSSETTLVHNGDTLTSQRTLRSIGENESHIVLAVDMDVRLTDEAMKTAIEGTVVRRVSKRLDPTTAHGEYIGISLIPHKLIPSVADMLRALIAAGADEYYEDAYDAIAQRTDLVAPQRIPSDPWIEVDTPQDLDEARHMFAL